MYLFVIILKNIERKFSSKNVDVKIRTKEIAKVNCRRMKLNIFNIIGVSAHSHQAKKKYIKNSPPFIKNSKIVKKSVFYKGGLKNHKRKINAAK